MKTHLIRPACLALTAALLPAAAGGLSKPLADFTIGDIFPRVVDDSFRQTGAAWREASRSLLAQASQRAEEVAATARQKRTEIAGLKAEEREARRSKDFVREGTLGGTRTSEAIVLDLLVRIEKLSEEQKQVAEAWDRAGRAMQKFVDVDETFDLHRVAVISRSEDPNAPDTRLNPDGYDAFVKHAKAMEALADSYRDLGAQVADLASQRMKFLNELERAGRIQPRKP